MTRSFLWTLSFVSVFLLTACGRVEMDDHVSATGLIPENFIPADVGMVLSYSTLNEAQYEAVLAIEKQLEDSSRVSRTASETLDTQLGEVGLDFERDLKPAFGEQFRMVYALRSMEDSPETFTVVTLADPRQMEEVLDTLVDSQQLSLKTLGTREAYVDTDSSLYLIVHEDLLLVSDDAQNILSMVEQEKENRLWNADAYRDSLKKLGQEFVFYAFLYPALTMGDVDLPVGFSVSNIPAVMDQQVFVVRAEDEGFRFDAYVNANKAAAKEVGVSFDAVPKAKPYLFEEIPAEGLMAYFESYGLQQTFEQADALGDDTSTLSGLRDLVRSYFAMDFDEDILVFLDRGYALSLHQNGEGVVPGLTVYVDISSAPDQAQRFVDKLDAQVSGLLMIFEGAMPEAVSKDTVEWNGSALHRLSFDLNALPRNEASPLPALVTTSMIQLVYGIQDDRLIVSTASDWDLGEGSVAESDLYETLSSSLDGLEEGLILLDAQGVQNFVASLRVLREQLNLQVSESAEQFEDFLDGFLGAMAQSETKAYESHFGGYLMLAE